MARKMKDSGIEWIGEIPEGWEVHRMKSCISQRDGGAWGDEATGETGDCICLRIADFDYEHVLKLIICSPKLVPASRNTKSSSRQLLRRLSPKACVGSGR